MEYSLRNFWFEGKRAVEDVIGLSGAEAHVHIGLALFVIAAVVLRHHRRGILMAWLFVMFAQTVNELLDARDWISWTGTVNWLETALDFLATLFWPTVLGLIWSSVNQKRDPNS